MTTHPDAVQPVAVFGMEEMGAGEAVLADGGRWAAEQPTIVALRAGEADVFRTLFQRISPMMRRVARRYVDSDAVAEEVVQDTWMAIVTGIDRFQGRSALETWIFSILIRQAKAHRARERRCLPFCSVGDGHGESAIVEAERCGPDGDAPGRWAIPSRPWQSSERRLLSLETREHLRRALAELPERQRLVVGLRDVEGLSAAEVSQLLGLSQGNQRVLLHRGRMRLQASLDAYLAEDELG